MRPAGFWRRCAAWSLDALPVGVASLTLALALRRRSPGTGGDALASAWASLVEALAHRVAAAVTGAYGESGAGALYVLVRGALRDPVLLTAADAVQAALAALVIPPLIAFNALFLAWCVGFERSPLRATPGKRALGLRVATTDGSAPGTGRLLLRFLAGALSWLSLNLGHLLAALPPRHQALHDRIAGTRVLQDPASPARLPAWSIAWLGLQVVLSLAAGACLFLAAHQAVERAFNALL